MRRALPIPLLLAAGALALAGCGGSSSSGGGATSAPATTSGATTSGPVQVKMQNIQFAPQTVTVKVGQKVTWVNDDSLDHNVTARSGATFASSTFGQGGTYSFTPTKAGTIAYVCTIHPGMTGTLVVVK